jgi:nitrite reductase/ring-hydroxylating ferredoxin subunit
LEEAKTKLASRDRAFYPRSWYYLGPVSDFSEKPASRTLFGKKLVVYRTDETGLVVQGGRCPHMNADLSTGCVKRGRLVCPMHGWEFERSGQCAKVPQSGEPPKNAKIPTFPVEVRNGQVFVFNGLAARFPLPWFEGERSGDFVFGKAITLEADGPWYLVSANGFDLGHFEFVHGRKSVSRPPVQISPDGTTCTIQHQFLNISRLTTDRVLRQAFGSQMSVHYQVVGGNLILIRTRIRDTISHLYIVVEPASDAKEREERCRVHVLPVMSLKGRSGLARFAAPLILALRRIFIKAFFEAEIRSVKGLRLNPYTLAETDQSLIQFMLWLVSLNPQESQ